MSQLAYNVINPISYQVAFYYEEIRYVVIAECYQRFAVGVWIVFVHGIC